MPAWILGLAIGLAAVGIAALPFGLGRAIVLSLVAAAAVATVRAILRIFDGAAAACDRAAAIRRIEAASGLAHRDLSTFEDRLADGTAAAATQALWAAHRRRARVRLNRLAVGWPRPDLPRRDRWALRPALGMLLFVGWFAADGALIDRFTATLAGSGREAATDRLDAWIEPPVHTGRPPVVLASGGAEPIEVIAGSRLMVRVAAGTPEATPQPIVVEVRPETALAEVRDEGGSDPALRRFAIVADGTVAVVRGGAEVLARRLIVRADRAPTVRLVEPPTRRGAGALRLVHESDDDFGVVGGEVRASPIGPAAARPVVEGPQVPLALPSAARGIGRGETVRDLTAHPFAGAAVRLDVTVRDAIDQEGRASVDVVLPERPFREPLARALIDLRRRLALDGEAVDAVAIGLDALTLAPEQFSRSAGEHLGLRHLARDAARARDDAAKRALIERLWTAALVIEVGDTLDSERALAQAREALAEALRSGASEEEIRRRMDALRQALAAHLDALREAARRDPSRADGEAGQRPRIDRQALDRALDRIEDLAKSGAREAAERMLAELGETLDAMRAARSAAPSARQKAQGEIGEAMRRQRDLMERTHRAEREGAGRETRDRLRREQGDLKDDLDRLGRTLDRLGKGTGAGGDTPSAVDGLGEAEGAMGEAEAALGEDDGGETALDAQGRALDGLRRAARDLAAGEEPGGRENEAASGGEDPLGRRRGGREGESRVGLPEEIDVERARQILDGIRRRLGEPERPRFERDYLERLLRTD